MKVWNNAAIQLVGYSTKEVMRKNLIAELITKNFMADVQSILDQALQGEERATSSSPS
jgi:PAS domain S-box-containing protein